MIVFVGATAAGSISGAVFNPAVGTGLMVVHASVHGASAIANLWLYWVAPIFGGLLAVGAYKVTNGGEYKK